ncbi:DUF4236 domain-containing protein [Chitinophaga arvensicola]|uniref:DUF4236 domain-containing protein n=1 Tax=Chitinophaga arvensicola TaxID=29529 RepID=A0A1I0QWU3_9BACT|nr:DUF4236 domain-containing protein [Chitinophaga arvensicola]SEW32237.1 Protein of unknown function [Chitinophaga arvensicola]
MGWSYRKSVSAGPFRINFSKKGISYSMGVKGARVNFGPSGTHVSLSAHGISYRKKISGPVSPSPLRIPATAVIETQNNIASATVEELTDSDSHAFITELNEKCKKVSYTKVARTLFVTILLMILFFSYGKREIIIRPATDNTIVRIVAFKGAHIRKEPDVKSRILKTVAYDQQFKLLDSADQKWFKVELLDSSGYVNRELAATEHLFSEAIKEKETYLVNEYLIPEILLCIILFIPLIFWLRKQDKKRFSMNLQYDIDDNYQQVYQQFKTHFVTFSRSARVWQYVHAEGTADYKRNAGAGKLIKRVRVRALSENKVPMPYFITNVAIPFIALNNMELYFLPERLLIKRGNTFAAVFYRNLRITGSISEFIESESLPHDARVIDYTWRYVNKSGGPDKRFNDNRRIPVCAYSQYTFTSGTGIFEIIATSKPSAMDNFAEFVMKIGALQNRMGTCYQ